MRHMERKMSGVRELKSKMTALGLVLVMVFSLPGCNKIDSDVLGE